MSPKPAPIGELKAFDRLISRVGRYERWLLAAVLVLATLRFVNYARRNFWFDEIFTFYISRLGSIDQILEAAPPDGNPPLYYLLASLCLRLIGESELAMRLPSIAGFIFAMYGVYVFVRRRCSALPAFFALFVLGTAAVKQHAGDARPYALVLGFTMLALLCWQIAAERRSHRIAALVGMTTGIAGAIASHHFGVFQVGIPLVAGELWRLYRRRRLDLPLYAAGAAGASMLLLTVPFALRTNELLLSHVRSSAVFYQQPGLWHLGSYDMMVDLRLVAIFAVLMLVLPRHAARPPEEPSGAAAISASIPGHEMAAAMALALLVPLMMAVAWFATNYFMYRYAIGASLGAAILMGYAAAAFGRETSRGHAAAVLSAAGLILIVGATDLARRLYPQPASGPQANPKVVDAAPAGQPIVVDSVLSYLPMWWYSPPDLQARLHYLTDISYAVRGPDPLGELTLAGERRFIPNRIDDYGTFLSGNRTFLMLCKITEAGACRDRTSWVKQRLVADGYRFSPIIQTSDQILYQVSRD
jgi:4-amino-4-deoxy-L-arabinose transferase-like glycosyltransferase